MLAHGSTGARLKNCELQLFQGVVLRRSNSLVLIVGAIVVVLLAWIGFTTDWKTRPPLPRGFPSAARQAPPPAELQSTELLLAKLPRQVTTGGFVSSTACRECHREQFDSWHGSFHRTMTQKATPETVVAPFDRVRLASRGREYNFSRKGEKFFVTMADPDWEAGALANGLDLARVNPPIVQRQVVMTTGSHHMQGYWISSKVGNMLRQIPWVYLIAEQRWVPREDIFLAPPEAERHLAVWNDNCIVCHAVAGAPKFDLQNIAVSTEVAELGISCEACHGPGQPHIDFQTSTLPKAAKQDPIVNPAKCDSRVSSEICGQCHSYFEPHDMASFATRGYTYRAGGDLGASHNLISYADAKEQGNESAMAAYWNDGTCRIAGREFSAMMESPCYQKGPMRCISCHSAHNSQPDDQLANGMRTNRACLQCHPKFGDAIQEHTHHAAESSGSQCTNCHMPHTSFGVLKAMRSHRIQVPRVVRRQQNDQPNACNLCHLDQTLAWSAEKLSAWYGQPRVELDQQEEEIAAGVLWLLQGHAVQRAIAAWHMQWEEALNASGANWQLPFLAQSLTDDYAVVRFVAGKALGRYAGFSQLNYDYVGNAKDRERVRQQTLELWSATAGDAPAQPARHRLLLDDQTAELIGSQVKELLELQDKRPIYLPE